MLRPLRTALSAALLLAALVAPFGAGAVAPGSQAIGCDRADEALVIGESSHLDPSCTWSKGIRIVASDVTLDCQGAVIASSGGGYGIHVIAPTDVPLSGVRVRNCTVDGFLNCLHIERDGFRELAEGVEYESAFSDIVIEDSTFRNSRGVGIFVNGYVTGVTLRRLHIEGTGSSGIYLETGSTHTIVEDNQIVNNGYRENGPGGQFFDFGGIPFWYWGPGREGVSVDGARFSTIRNNYFEGNSAGSILLYKNCGEFPGSPRYFERRYGAHGNVIEGNTFFGEINGVWVASRMAENTLPMNCTDPQYAPGYVLDYANDNVVRDNDFVEVPYGVRVEDDRTTVEDNRFVSTDPAHVGVLLGTPLRTTRLGLPVADTHVTGNRAEIAGNTNPYRWVHGHVGTVFTDNHSEGRPAGLCEGAPPVRGPFVMTTGFVPAPGGVPPDVEQPPLPGPEALPPCPTTCASGVAPSHTRLEIRHRGTPPGDDRLSFRARLALEVPFDPPFDPIARGIGFVVETSSGERRVDLLVPGGAWDRTTRVGWKPLRSRAGWRYTDRRADPLGGIQSVVIHDLSSSEPGTIEVRVKGRRGSYPVTPADLPLTAIVSVDPPTAETGQCARAAFDGTAGRCSRTGTRVVCR